jgi:hypothetical protein
MPKRSQKHHRRLSKSQHKRRSKRGGFYRFGGVNLPHTTAIKSYADIFFQTSSTEYKPYEEFVKNKKTSETPFSDIELFEQLIVQYGAYIEDENKSSRIEKYLPVFVIKVFPETQECKVILYGPSRWHRWKDETYRHYGKAKDRFRNAFQKVKQFTRRMRNPFGRSAEPERNNGKDSSREMHEMLSAT